MEQVKLNFAILASGSGSNAESIVLNAPKNAEIKLIITDKADAGVIERAQRLQIQCVVIPKCPTKSAFEEKILEALRLHKIDWVLLAGFMRILSANFLQHWFDRELKVARVVNIHPSLLPKYPGVDGYGDAFKSGDAISGITIHFVDAGMDTGPIILQKSFPRLKDDTLESFKKRGLELEHESYPQVLKWIIENKIVTSMVNSKILVKVENEKNLSY